MAFPQASETTEVPPTPPPAPMTAAQEAKAATLQEDVDLLYVQLEPDATVAYVNYYLSRTPADMQEMMKAKVESGLPNPPDPAPEPDPTVASVANGSSVTVLDLAGTEVPGSPGTAEVASSALTGVKLTV